MDVIQDEIKKVELPPKKLNCEYLRKHIKLFGISYTKTTSKINFNILDETQTRNLKDTIALINNN